MVDQDSSTDRLMNSAYEAGIIRSLEAPLLDEGQPLMQEAAQAVAVNAWLMLSQAGLDPQNSRIVLLAGGGNNGGDGLYAGARLAAIGADVTAVATSSDVLDEAAQTFVQAGGILLALSSDADIPSSDAPSSPQEVAERIDEAVELAQAADLVIDAMTGIGLTGALRGIPETLASQLSAHMSGETEEVNTGEGSTAQAHNPLILAVDIPSGVGVDDGSLPGPYLPADVTVTFGAMKPCLLLPPAAYACGHIVLVDFGFDVDEVQASVEAMSASRCSHLLRVPEREDSKYTRGVVGLVTGSENFPGAAVLSTRACASCGVGMVRYLGPERPSEHVLAALPEAVLGPGRVEAWVLGSGVAAAGSSKQQDSQRSTIAQILEAHGSWPHQGSQAHETEDSLPMVVDAGALDLLPAEGLGPKVVLTPHAGELAALLQDLGEDVTASDIAAEPVRWATRTWELTGATVLLKGAITLVVGDGQGQDPAVYTTGFGPAWLSTAGSGDVLAGLEGALLASQSTLLADDPRKAIQLAAAGAYIHAYAANLASHSQDRAWRQPLLFNPDQGKDFIEEANRAWQAGSRSVESMGPLGHPIHAADIIDQLERAQGLLLALPFQSDPATDEPASADGDDDWAAEPDEDNMSSTESADSSQASNEPTHHLSPAALVAIESLWF
ncbi:carbohydrate kinase [Bombiscardovia nodaiensis]|uniref:Multifunctional fusion protein n=1 Tax=Bombiscardovia nodaiensis TaxID=2932181 RepID=A0ABN6SA87_9BIFI|nr:carbohydrate kinase [Bombiscardovia nodaiensis]